MALEQPAVRGEQRPVACRHGVAAVLAAHHDRLAQARRRHQAASTLNGRPASRQSHSSAYTAASRSRGSSGPTALQDAPCERPLGEDQLEPLVPQHAFLVAADQRQRRLDQVPPQLAGGGTPRAQPEPREILGVVDDRRVRVGDAGVQDGHQAAGRKRRRRILVGQPPVVAGAQRADRRGGHREIHRRAFLRVEHAQLERAAVEARDRAARVEPLVLHHAVRIEGRHLAVHRRENLGAIGRLATHRLGDDVAEHRRHARGVRQVALHAVIEHRLARAVGDRRAGGQRRQDRQHAARGGDQARQLGVAGERQVDVHALHVGPGVAAAIEDAVVGGVDLGVFVRPEPGLAARVHPGMHAGRHEACAERREACVHRAHRVLKALGERFEPRFRALAFQFQKVQHQLVRPAEAAEVQRIDHRARGVAQQCVGDRPHRERVAVDDHVLELDAGAGKGVQGFRRHQRVRLRSSMRRTMVPMISRYRASFSTSSSTPASTLGLSFTSTT